MKRSQSRKSLLNKKKSRSAIYADAELTCGNAAILNQQQEEKAEISQELKLRKIAKREIPH